MGKTVVQVAILFLSVCISSLAVAVIQGNFGIPVGSEGINGFHISAGNYYRVPEREVMVIRERGIHDEELDRIPAGHRKKMKD